MAHLGKKNMQKKKKEKINKKQWQNKNEQTFQ